MRRRPLWPTLAVTSQTRRTATEGGRDDPGNDDVRGSRPVREDLRDEGCREAQAARLEGLDGLPRPAGDRPRLGDLRLGPGRVGEVRERSRGAADHAGGRAQGPAAGRRAARPVRGVSLIQESMALVRRSYRALDEADTAALTELFDEHASWHTPGSSPVAGDAVGRDAVFT